MSATMVFLVGIIGTTYSYFIYPTLLLFMRKKDNPEINENEHPLPFISFIITAYNEENQISEKLENTLLIKYPQENFEIIVASDGSTDGTNSIVQKFSSKGILLHHVTERKGKENAQRSAIGVSKGSILVFSDVSTKIEPKALIKIASRFNNPKIGAISSEDRFISAKGEIAGEGAYVKYEMWLRKLEGSVNTLVGLSGSFFAARKEICQNWDINIPSDFNTAINCIKHNYYAISDPKLLGFYPNLEDESKEYKRKVRTVIRGIAALFSQKSVLNPFKYGLFSFQIFSHKVMRWLVPWFMVLTLYTNILLYTTNAIFKITLIIQLFFYCLSLLGGLSKSLRNFTIIKIPYFFLQVNIAIAHASVQFLFGKRVTVWEPSKR